MTPQPLGTIWTAQAKIQRINTETRRWDTLAVCLDTPSAIRSTLTQLSLPLTGVWVAHLFGRVLASDYLDRRF